MAQDTLTPELQLERDRLLRRRRITESMLAQSQQPLGQPGPGIALSPFQGLAQLAQAYVGKNQLQANDKALENIGTRYNEGLAKAVKDYIATGTVPIDPQEVEQNADQGTPLPKPDPRARVAQALQALTSPYAQVRQMGMLDFNAAQQDKTRAEAREARMQELQIKLADTRLAREDRAALQAQLAAMQDATRREIAAGNQAVRRDVAEAAEAARAQKNTPKLPTPALKLQQEELDAIGIAQGVNADLGALEQQITDGKLNLSLIGNAINDVRNTVGLSTEESRNLNSFRATLEKMRNDSLRLNKGVQTEGDAVRAWNELIAKITDKDVVKQRLAEIRKINERAATLRRNNIDVIRSNFGLDPLDTSAYERPGAAVGTGASPVAGAPGAPKVLKFDAAGNPIP